MRDQEVGDFKRGNQVITLTSKTDAKVGDDTISVDPQLLFQRLTAVGNLLMEDTGNMFRYELSTFPSSLFEPSGWPREANKPDCIWNMGDCSCNTLPSTCIFVLDGGSLLQRLPWSKNATFEAICQSYLDYVTKRYQNVVVVFDVYPNYPTTKDVTHTRRSRGITGPEIHFTENMPCKSRKETFLSNTKNKQNFINLLGRTLSSNGIRVNQAEADADLDIVKTAISFAESQEVVVMGEDTDILILLCHHASLASGNIHYTTEQKKGMYESTEYGE
jgi:hypothetical protein